MLLKSGSLELRQTAVSGEGTTCMNLVDQVALLFYEALELPSLSGGLGNSMLPYER
jgi:hypothetical protein